MLMLFKGKMGLGLLYELPFALTYEFHEILISNYILF